MVEVPVPSWRYEPFTPLAAIDIQARSWGMCLADLNGDRRLDIYLPRHLDRALFVLQDRDTFRTVFPRQVPGFSYADHHGARVIDSQGDGCAELHQVSGAGGGEVPQDNWFLESDCLRRITDRAEGAGLDDPTGRGRLPLWLDFNGDGAPDVIVLNESGGSPSQLLRGDGRGHFDDVGIEWEFPRDEGWVSGAAADLDDDGDTDLVLAGERVVIMENHGTHFSEAGELDVLGIARVVATDIDGDSVTDLAVATRGPESDVFGRPTPGHLKYKLRTDGLDPVGFDWRSDADSLWLAPVAGFDYRRLSTFLGGQSINPDSLPCHVNLDDPALVGEPSALGQAAGTFLWVDDDRNWHLRVVGSSAGGELRFDSTKGWIQLNSTFDTLAPVGFSPAEIAGAPNCLFRGHGDLSFEDVSEASGFRDGLRQSRDIASADLDNDGDLDLVVANGAVVENQRDRIYLNDGGGRFNEFGRWLGFEFDPLGSGEAVATGDLDGDGFPEVMILEGHSGHPFVGGTQVYSPVHGGEHWLGVDVSSSPSGHTNLGARVRIVTEGRSREREYDGGQSHYSQDDPRLFFGLGEASHVDSLVVRWGSGEQVMSTSVSVDQVIHTDDLAGR